MKKLIALCLVVAVSFVGSLYSMGEERKVQQQELAKEIAQKVTQKIISSREALYKELKSYFDQDKREDAEKKLTELLKDRGYQLTYIGPKYPEEETEKRLTFQINPPIGLEDLLAVSTYLNVFGKAFTEKYKDYSSAAWEINPFSIKKIEQLREDLKGKRALPIQSEVAIKETDKKDKFVLKDSPEHDKAEFVRYALAYIFDRAFNKPIETKIITVDGEKGLQVIAREKKAELNVSKKQMNQLEQYLALLKTFPLGAGFYDVYANVSPYAVLGDEGQFKEKVGSYPYKKSKKQSPAQRKELLGKKIEELEQQGEKGGLGAFLKTYGIEESAEIDDKTGEYIKITTRDEIANAKDLAGTLLAKHEFKGVGFYKTDGTLYHQSGEFNPALFEKRSILRPALWIAGGGLLLGAAYLYQNPEVAEKLQQRSLELYGQHMAPLFAAAREGFGGYMQKFGETVGGYWPFKK